MADRKLEIAVILSAYDRMSNVINNAVNRAQSKLATMAAKSNQIADKSFSAGRNLTAMGLAAGATLVAPIKAFAEMEDAGLRLKSVMMRDGGIVPEDLFKKMNDQAVMLGNKLPGTTADFQNLYATLLEQGTPAQAILNGTGKAAAYLAVQLKIPGEEAAILASRLRLQMGIVDKDMMGFMDIMARIKNVGVNPTEMQYAFGKSAGAMKLLNVQGLQASKTLGTLYAMLIREGGATGETAGTGISKIMNELMNPTKMAKFNEQARSMGLSFEFFKNGKFLGLENFVSQLTKFGGMDPEKISKLLGPLTGGEGMDNQFLASLSKMGTSGFNKMSEELARQATLEKKVELMLTSLSNIWESTVGTFTNTMAVFTETFSPTLKEASVALGELAAKLQVFIEKHPTMFKYIGLGISLFSVLAVGGGVLGFAIGGVAKTFFYFSQALSFAGTVIKGVQFAIFALRYNFVYTLWPAIVSATTAVWGFVLAMGPIAWTVVAVVALGAAFVIAYQKCDKFRAIIQGVMAVGKLLLNLFVAIGKTIIGAFTFNPKMVMSGFKDAASLTSKMMDGEISKTFSKAYNASMSVSADGKKIAPAKVGGGSNIKFSPTINLSGGATKQDGQNINQSLRTEFKKMMRDHEEQKRRVAY